MRVTIIGSGNVATVLGRKMLMAGHTIEQVYSREHLHAAQLASELQATPTTDINSIGKRADIYLISVADKVIETLANQINVHDKLIVHTAGSVKMDVLRNSSENYGILYPLQSLRKELSDAPFLPILVDANPEWNRTRLLAFAQSFSDRVVQADDEQRSKLHLAAVISNNFSNYLFSLAEEYCVKEGVEFKMIVPLLEETAHRLHVSSPADVQTGPAIRNDTATMERHLEMLAEFPELAEFYARFSERIISREAAKIR